MAKQTATQSRRTPARPTPTRRTEGATRRVRREESKIQWSIPLGRRNLMMMVGAVVLIVIGYLLMATAISSDPADNEGIWNNANAVTWAPILLVIGYCIIVPIAIMWRPKDEAGGEERETAA